MTTIGPYEDAAYVRHTQKTSATILSEGRAAFKKMLNRGNKIPVKHNDFQTKKSWFTLMRTYPFTKVNEATYLNIFHMDSGRHEDTDLESVVKYKILCNHDIPVDFSGDTFHKHFVILNESSKHIGWTYSETRS